MLESYIWDYIACLVLGGLVGLVELFSRYRDEPSQAVRTAPGVVYLVINGLASLAALFLVRVFDVAATDLGATTDIVLGIQWCVMDVALAGFGAALVMRAALFRFHHDDRAIPIGPAAILDVLLLVTDRAVDRRRAIGRDEIVQLFSQDLRHLKFNEAYDELPAYCLGLMQNVASDEQRRLGQEVLSIKSGASSDEVKVRLLLLALLNVVGEDVLTRGIQSFVKDQTSKLPKIESWRGGMAFRCHSLRPDSRRLMMSKASPTGMGSSPIAFACEVVGQSWSSDDCERDPRHNIENKHQDFVHAEKW